MSAAHPSISEMRQRLEAELAVVISCPKGRDMCGPLTSRPIRPLRGGCCGSNIEVEYTREALVMHVDRSIDCDTVVALLVGLIAERGAPEHLRMNNRPGMTAHALVDWCTLSGTRTAYIDPKGRPGRGPTSRVSTPASAPSCSTSESSPACPKPKW